jgi:hypothetical protein
MRGLDVTRGLAGLTTTLLALAAAMPGAAGGTGGVGGRVGAVGGGASRPAPQTETGSPPVSKPPPLPGLPSLVGPPCAAATAQTLVSIDGNVAERIYRDELVGTGTIADQHQVEENGPLLKALAKVNKLAKGKGNGTGARAVREAAKDAVTEAVHQLVYSH